jgi:hypothetical protein
MDDQKSKQKLEAVRKLLGEPVFIGFSDYVLKLRRNLVAMAVFIIFYKWTNLKINIISGLDCTEVPKNKIDIFLASYLVYSLLYFVSEALETYSRWKIRLSGTFADLNQLRSDNKALVTTLEKFDVVEAIKLKDIGYGLGEQSYLFSTMAQAIYANSANLKDKPEIGLYYNCSENSNKNKFFENRVLLTSEAILEIVKTGLDRFQKGFYNFQKLQIIRFFFFDIFVPLVLTGLAFFMLFL